MEYLAGGPAVTARLKPRNCQASWLAVVDLRRGSRMTNKLVANFEEMY
ncbi:hypothetical protein [Parazoarcus communis]|jgi:hypothetical protein|nr:hypothetical protein [Parazoarcus communis]